MHLEYLFMHKFVKIRIYSHISAYAITFFQHFCTFCPT